MADVKFDSKSFNPEAFGKYTQRVPSLKRNELIKSKALTGNQDIRNAFSSQTGTFYARIPMFGTLDGDTQNYDGKTDIVPTSTTTFEQGVVVFGRMKSWEEKDFSYDITGGVDFMDNVANQVVGYWDEKFQGELLAILKGIFAMTGVANEKFINAHTLDISAAEGADVQGNPNNMVGSATLNTATQKACGDNKSAFTLVIMHSNVATNLENLKLLKYMTYTDADGITRELSLGSWNGRTVLVDDGMPVDETGDVPVYTTYILGDGAFAYEEIGAKVPYEMVREAFKEGGKDVLISRQRKCLAPKGISFEVPAGMGNSPSKANFEDGANWTIVHDGGVGSNRKHYDHKAIPIARIISRG
jgi:hypothetical protein